LKDENGFTLYFEKGGDLQSAIPFSLGKFLLSNKYLLMNEIYVGKNTEKEISVVIEKSELEFYSQHFHLSFFSLKPSFSNLLAELAIELNITTEL
jgi:hypothetical protein